MRHHVQVLVGSVRFVDPHTVVVSGTEERTVSADIIVIATRRSPSRTRSPPSTHGTGCSRSSASRVEAGATAASGQRAAVVRLTPS